METLLACVVSSCVVFHFDSRLVKMVLLPAHPLRFAMGYLHV